ncbi:MAG: hypothetical protein ACOYVK_16410 [Bacillota bacterium]
MLNNLGIDTTDDYLRQELSTITKDVAVLREKIIDVKTAIQNKTNSDELIHLQYDLEDAHVHLNTMLDHLKIADEKYLCFKEYLRRNNE